MPTTDELVQLGPDAQFGHIWLIDGDPIAFTDHHDLVGFDTGTGHVVRLGLQREGTTLRMAVDLRTGQLDDSAAKFKLLDLQGDLASLWAAVDDSERPLTDVPFGVGQNISPGDDLSARTELHGLNVGVERIGSAGERRRYPCVPGFTIGLQHRVSSPSLDLGASPVSESTLVRAGRRCCLYRVFRDHVAHPSPDSGPSSWRPFSEARRIWWGTLRDQGTVAGYEWTLDADGPESWLRRPLGIGYQTEPVRVVGEINLSDEERGMAGSLFVLDGLGVIEAYGGREFVALVSGTTVAEIRQSVLDEIQAIAATPGSSGTWATTEGYSVSMAEDCSIRICIGSGTLGTGVLQLCLHSTVWMILGYDLIVQDKLSKDEDDPTAISNASDVTGVGSYSNTAPGPGYQKAQFWTGRPDWPRGFANAGLTRVYRGLYGGGTHLLRADLGGGQVVRLADATLAGGASQSTVAHPGQLDRPPASRPADNTQPASIDGVDVDRQGLFLFFGKRRIAGTAEEIDEFQVGRCSWRGGTVTQEGLVSGDTILLHEWLRPRRFGFDRPVLESDWVARADSEGDNLVKAVPILSLSYLPSSVLEPVHVVLQRLLQTTGTSTGWSSYSGDPSATLDEGANEPAGAHTVPRDAEVAELGLGIPASMVGPPASWSAEASLVDDASILDVKVAFSPGMQSEDLIQGLMMPLGWCWHLRGGRYGVYCPAHPITLADATVVLDRRVKAVKYGDEDHRTRQELRAFSPIDKFTFEHSWAPHENKFAKKIEHASPDAGTRYRTGTQTHRVLGHGHRDSTPWRTRADVLARWWSRRHFWVRSYPIFAINPGSDVWPGTIVRFSDPSCIDAAGAYGVTNRLGIVTSTTEDLGRGAKSVDILVLADSSNTPRMHAMSARGLGFDPATNRIYVADNWLAIESGSTWSDAARFVEPSYEDIVQFGGNARIQWTQWDGSTWSVTGTSYVASVNTTPGSSYIQLTGVPTGRYYRDMDAILFLDQYADQDGGSWVRTLYGVVCGDDGQFGATAGFPWEQ